MPEEKHLLKVFLCHAHSDKSAVHDLYLRLIKDGVDAWLDKEKIMPGQDWEFEIRKAVREADVVVVCLSKQFNQAGFRQKEVRLALDTAMEQPEGGIFIIPARLEECENLESLRKWHWVDLFEEDGYQRFRSVLKSQSEKMGAITQTQRSGKVNSGVLPERDANIPKASNVFSDLDVGGQVSGSVIVTGNGNVINLNRTTPSQADANDEIDVVEDGIGNLNTKIRLQTKSLENVFAFLQNRLQTIYPKAQTRIKTLHDYPDGIARKVTYSETLTLPNRVGNKLIV